MAAKDFSADAIAQLLGITARRLQQLAAEGFIPKGERGRYPLVESVQGYVRYLKQTQRATSRSSEHQRLAKAQAVKVEMANLRQAGQLILHEQVFELLAKLTTEITSGLESIPGRTASEFASISDPALIRQRQQDEHRKLRDILANTLELFAESCEDLEATGESGEAAEATSSE